AAVGGADRRGGDHRPLGGRARETYPRCGGGEVIVASEHLSKWYGQVSGLNDVTIQVPPGITGLLGEPIWGNPALFQRIGFCPEQDSFYDRMTGREWVTALTGLHGFDEKAAGEAAAKAIAAVELTEAADRKIGSYSKGMRQRIKLAQAIAHEPELLILDEPLSGMDPLMRRRTVKQIK